MKLLDGKKIASQIEAEVAQAILQSKKEVPPGLAFVLVGQDPASRAYIQMKKKKCAEVGIRSIDKEYPETVSEEELIKTIHTLNNTPFVNGILVQLPLPKHICVEKIMEAIAPHKDVDAFHPLNVGKMFLGETGGFLPCTPQGIITLLVRNQIHTAGKHVVIVGRSNIVGKPLAALLMQKTPSGNATVTVAHRASEHLQEICKSADILIAAVGKPKMITPDFVKKGAVIIDVGINRTAEGIVGDVDAEAVAPFCSHLSPVPGGVGPMTIAMLLVNTLKAYLHK